MEVMVEFMEKLNMWLRRWAVPMKIFGECVSVFLRLLGCVAIPWQRGTGYI